MAPSEQPDRLGSDASPQPIESFNPTESSGPPGRSKPPKYRRWLRLTVSLAVVAAAVLLLAPRLGTSDHRMGPGSVAIGFWPTTSGRTTLGLPPLGQASAPTHRGPVELRMELRSVDVPALIGTKGNLDPVALRSSIEADTRSALIAAVIQFGVVSAVIGAVVGAALPWRGRASVIGGTLFGALVAVALAASALPGFNGQRFDELTYEGPLTAGRQMMQSISTADGPLGQRVTALTDRLAGLYSAGITQSVADTEGEVVILHISDLHLNPIGAQLARRLATTFDVDAVVDTGDTTSFGSSFEGVYAEALADFPVPYLFVAGNHDSRPNRRAIKATPGVTALHNTVVDVDGVTIAGFDDPVITTADPLPRDERESIELAAAPEVSGLLGSERPDVLAVHNPVILRELVGEVPVAIAGHMHRSQLGARDGTLVWMVGSTGATGLGSLLVDSDTPASAALLRFRDGELIAIDDLEVVGTAGDLQIRRRVITDKVRNGDNADFIGSDVDEGIGPLGTSTTSSPTTTTDATAPTTTADGVAPSTTASKPPGVTISSTPTSTDPGGDAGG
ncbi:MAG: metallophosphoesterase family protein [Candidatus Microthrix sp.]|nr:metallophosphoesterase family protein [Candidatus Microthrix sp.]